MSSFEHRKRMLLDRLAELDTRLHAIEAELDAPADKDWEERAVEREDDEVLERLGQTGQVEIRRIRSALQRIRDGEYGTCISCGQEISDKRLDVLPDTPLCKDCAGQLQ